MRFTHNRNPALNSSTRKSLKVAFFTRGPLSTGSARVRVLAYLKHLEASGVATSVLARPSKATRMDHFQHVAQALRLAKWADVVFLQKPNQSRPFLELLRRMKVRIVVDVDDAIWAPPPSRIGHGSRRVSKKFQERFLDAAVRAEFVIAGSEHLATTIRRFSLKTPVAVIPPSVDLEFYDQPKVHIADRAVTIGWIGSHGNLSDLRPVLPALRSVCLEYNAKLRIISSRPPDLNGFSFEFNPWSVDTEIALLRNLDIGIMPLQNDERSIGRCGYKAIQYMAVGLPVITTPAGAGSEIVAHERTGFHATTLDDWKTHLIALIQSKELRERMGSEGRRKIEETYTVQKNVHRMIDIFQYSLRVRS